MKTLSLTQPWATLLAYRFKQIETRSWRTPYRGLIALTRLKGVSPHDRALCEEYRFETCLVKAFFQTCREDPSLRGLLEAEGIELEAWEDGVNNAEYD